jgi:hypothetical protein
LLWFLAVETCSIWFAFVVSIQFVVIPLVENLSATQRKFMSVPQHKDLTMRTSHSALKVDSGSWTLSPVCYTFWLLTTGSFMLMEDKSRAGAWLSITNERGFEYWPDKKVSYVMPKEKKYIMSSAGPKFERTPHPHLETPPPIPKEFCKV